MVIELKGRVISKKNSKRWIYRGGRKFLVPSVAYAQFKNDALWQLKAIKEKYRGHIAIHYEFCIKGRYDIDCDNAQASINDILQDAGIIDNDKNICKGSFEKQNGYPDWLTKITIEKI